MSNRQESEVRTIHPRALRELGEEACIVALGVARDLRSGVIPPAEYSQHQWCGSSCCIAGHIATRIGVAERNPAHRMRVDHSKSTPPEPPPPLDVADSDIPAAQRCTISSLTNETCRWPVGDPGTPGFFFCGHASADVDGGQPYCAAHAKRAFSGQGGRV